MIEYPLLVILIPVIFAILIYLIRHPLATLLAYLSQGVLLAVGLYHWSSFLPEGDVTVHVGNFGERLNITLQGDPVTYLYSLLTMVLWLSVILYSWPHRKKEAPYYFFLLFLQGAFMGIIHTADFFNLFLFIEIATILSAILIIYKKDGPSLRAGIYYLVFNTAGILLFLLGLTLLYRLTGTLNMHQVREILSGRDPDGAVMLIFSLMVVSMGVKSAFFPVYNWLPRAHSVATSSISAILSGVMVKSGVIGLYKIQQVMGMDGYRGFLMSLGLITALSGLIFGYSQWSIKRLLAFSTISHIGLIVMGFSTLDNEWGFAEQGGLIHIANHGFLKILLFLCAGMIVRNYREYDLRNIRGIWQRMPVVAVILAFATLSVAGFPLFLAYQSKTMIGMGLSSDPLFYLGYHLVNLGTVILFSKLLLLYRRDLKEERWRIHLCDHGALYVLTTGILVLNGAQVFQSGLGPFLFAANPFSLAPWITFAVYLGGAALFQNRIKPGILILERIRSFELSFQAANYMMVLFLFLMILWSHWFV